MVTAGHLTIDRAHPARALEAYRRAAEVIRSGTSALLFPEGTRSRTGELLPFKNAPFGLAIAAQVPVVPVDRKSTRLNSSHTVISYAVFCLKKKKNDKQSITVKSNQVLDIIMGLPNEHRC